MGGVGAFYLSGAITNNAHAKETGFLGAEAMANAEITYNILKTATGRERPLVGAGNGRFWDYNRLGSSFPSGHSTLTWAGAAVIAHEYPKRWVQILAYGTATAVAFTRYSGRRHFPSDVFVGSAVGYLIGTHIFRAHCAKGNNPSCERDQSDGQMTK
jgi:membrane-associated phospholipid phosphatase